MTRLLRLLAAAAAAALLVAACGGDDGGSTASGGSATTPAAPAATTEAPGGGETSTGTPGGGETSTGTPGGGETSTGTITIKDFQYGEPLTVRPGATITVVNEDVARHDVVADSGDAFKTPLLGKGERATFTAPSEPGTYKFSCSVHPASMSGIGTLIVQP